MGYARKFENGQSPQHKTLRSAALGERDKIHLSKN